MNKDRLDWVMSGLNQYNLTTAEEHFVKTAMGDFDQQKLTPRQEETLEHLYKEKSKMSPNKKSSKYYAFAESTPKKTRPRKLRSSVL